MILREVEALAASIATTPWFARVGRTPEAAESDDLRLYAVALGFEPGTAATVSGWAEAARIAADPTWDRRWWEAEALEQKRLQSVAESRHGPEAALTALTRVAEAALDPILQAALDASGDPALARAAAGAAAQACHQAGLATAAGAAGHGFLAKHRLFARGRWPLGRIADRWYLF